MLTRFLYEEYDLKEYAQLHEPLFFAEIVPAFYAIFPSSHQQFGHVLPQDHLSLKSRFKIKFYNASHNYWRKALYNIFYKIIHNFPTVILVEKQLTCNWQIFDLQKTPWQRQNWQFFPKFLVCTQTMWWSWFVWNLIFREEHFANIIGKFCQGPRDQDMEAEDVN